MSPPLRSTMASPVAIASPSRPSHNPATPITTHNAVVTWGHGDTTARIGAKKKPVPTYHAEPVRSQIKTMRSHRGVWFSDMPSRSAARVARAITFEVMAGTTDGGQTQWMAMRDAPPTTVGAMVRRWRARRRLSQLDLALEADVSARHVSFVETGRATPSRAMVLRLAGVLDVPRREQNRMLLAAGHAPAYTERPLDAPEMAAVQAGLDRVLEAYEPYPCIVVNRVWDLLTANAGANVLLEGVAPHLLDRPNALRIALHPDGLAPRIRNLGQWRSHLAGRLRREAAADDTGELTALLDEIEGYPGGEDRSPDLGGVAVPLELITPDGVELRLLSMVTTFGTALDLTAAEVSIEAFLPADAATAAALQSVPCGDTARRLGPKSPGDGT